MYPTEYTWMSVATWVTISVITIPSGSRAKERSTWREPLRHIVQRWFSKKRSCAGRANMLQKATSATMHDATITPTAMAWLAFFPYRFCRRAPKAVLRAAPRSGKKGISHSQEISIACATASFMSSLAQEVGLFHVDGAEGLVDGEHDGEPHRRLRRRQHDDEDAEDLAGELRRRLDEVVEGDEVHVGGVQEQLDHHEDADRVPPRHHGDHAEREQDGADDEEMRQLDGGHVDTSEVSLISLRAITTAPISAASSTTEATSKGSR